MSAPDPQSEPAQPPPDPPAPRRPKRYSRALARAVCRRLARGESLLQVSADRAMPAYSTVMNWVADRPEFREMYAQARMLQSHALADEILNVIRCDKLPPADKQARIKGLAWLAAKLNPAKYGDRAQVVPDAGAGGAGFTVIVAPAAPLPDPIPPKHEETDDDLSV